MKREHSVSRGVGTVLNNLADFAIHDGDPDAAVALLRESIAASAAHGDEGARSVALGNLTVALAELGRFDEALATADEAHRTADAAHDPGRMLGARRARALALLHRAQAATPGSSARVLALREAAGDVRPAIASARAAGDPLRALQLTELLADIHEAQGEAAAALAELRATQAQRDAIEANRRVERRATAQARFAYAARRSELELLRERQTAAGERLRIERWLVLALALAALAASAAALLALRRTREQQRFQAALKTRHEALAAAWTKPRRCANGPKPTPPAISNCCAWQAKTCASR